MDFEKQQLEARLKVVKKQINYINIIDAPAMVIIGLGLFSKFGEDPGSLHPIFTDSNIVNGALAIAVPWAVFCGYKSIKLAIEASKLTNKINS